MKKVKKIYLVGITGPAGVGKTTLSKKLKSANKDYERIRFDNYFKRPTKKMGKWLNWELPENLKFDVLLKHLELLKSGNKIKINKRKPITIKPRKVIIIEGFTLFNDKKIRDILDVKIYLDIPEKLMFERRTIRFEESKISDYTKQVGVPEFLKYGVRQKKYADYVVDATQSQSKVIKEVQKIIKSKTTNS